MLRVQKTLLGFEVRLALMGESLRSNAISRSRYCYAKLMRIRL